MDLHQTQVGIDEPDSLATCGQILADFLPYILGQIARRNNFNGQCWSTLNGVTINIDLFQMNWGDESDIGFADGFCAQVKISFDCNFSKAMCFHKLSESPPNLVANPVVPKGS